MNIEKNRLETFGNWPANAPINAIRLARAGFYYTGFALEVQCFFCGTRISDWNYNDQAFIRHREAAPDCPFIQDRSSTCNVPLLLTMSTANELPSTSNDLQTKSDSETSQSQNEYTAYSERLKTFQSWPIPSIVSAERLAKAGFRYLLTNDTVQCAYCCGGIVKNWKPGDDPEEIHRQRFPECDFHLQQNIYETLHSKNITLMPGTTSNLTKLGIQAHSAPKQPNYATYDGRLRTFYGWPENMKQSPEVLASAGFYYIGMRDTVTCFHCGGSLGKWEPTDDVWTEHARWFPKCEYVNLTRGREFIQHCIDNRPPLLPSIFEGVPEDDGPNPPKISTISTVASDLPSSTREFPINDSSPCELPSSTSSCDAPSTSAFEIASPAATTTALESPTSTQEIVEPNELETLDDKNTPSLDIINGKLNALHRRVGELKQFNEVLSKVIQVLDEKENRQLPDNNDNATSKKSNAKADNAFLEDENRRLKEARLCKICMDRELAIVFLPCGHLATCVNCALSLKYCQMCREEIRATVRTFLS